MPTKLKRFLLTQPDGTTVEDLCSKASSRMIVDRLYLEDDDNAFNEISSISTKEILTGIQELSRTIDSLKSQQTKMAEELKQLSQNKHQQSAEQNNQKN